MRLRRALPALALVGALSIGAAADVFIVRHAEKQDPRAPKSLLSRRGLRRARELSRVLAAVPLRAVYVTEYERTRQTAAPAAAAHGLTPVATDSGDVKALARLLLARPEDEDVLVVGHSDTIPDLLTDLGVSTRAAISPDEYDELFIVSPRHGRAPDFHVLRYGASR